MDKVDVKVVDSSKKLPLVFSVDSQSSEEIDTSVTQKIGDEVDVSIDYVMDSSDKQWVAGLIKIEYGKEMQKHITCAAFETIINILERYTAFSVHAVPLVHATKLIGEQLSTWNTTSPIIAAVLARVYTYWQEKRTKIGKPLCRRYWPQVASSDCNPHQVFRTRDKERYRLRKTQKRNDVEAFRKMQQLRKDFSRAKVLLELVLERETLREADFEVQREIFAQRLHDLDTSDHAEGSRPLRREVPFTHSLKFDHFDPDELPSTGSSGGKQHQTYSHTVLLCSSEDSYDMDSSPPPKRQNTSSSSGLTASSAGIKKSSSLVDLTATSFSSKKSGSTAQLSGSSATTSDARKSLSASSSAQTNKTSEKKATTTNTEKKKKKDLSRMVMYTVSNGQTVEMGTGAVLLQGASSGVTAATVASSNGTNGLHGNNSSNHPTSVDGSGGNGSGSSSSGPMGGVMEEVRIIHPNCDGPPTLCQPIWPTFMTPLPVRDTVVTSSHRSYSNYLDDLELRRDPLTGRVIPPDKYRGRCRVGRGGRLIMDRIPVYSAPLANQDYWTSTDDSTATTHCDVTYIYPTSARHQQYNAVLTSHKNAMKQATVGIAPAVSVLATSPDNAASAHQPQYTLGSTRLPEVPLSNRKIVKYNIKARNNNQLVAGAANTTGTAMGTLLQRVP
eukprot:gene30038-37188_t